MLLSAATMIKQRANHPDLTLGDYGLLADILETPDVAVEDAKPRHAVLVKVVRGTFWLVVKATADGGENFVVSFRRADIGNLRSLRRRGVAVPIGDLDALIRDAEVRRAARGRRKEERSCGAPVGPPWNPTWRQVPAPCGPARLRPGEYHRVTARLSECSAIHSPPPVCNRGGTPHPDAATLRRPVRCSGSRTRLRTGI